MTSRCNGLLLGQYPTNTGTCEHFSYKSRCWADVSAHILLVVQVDAGVKGVSPGPFTEEFLTVQQRNLRILGGLSMAGEYS